MTAFHRRVSKRIKELREQGEEERAKRLEGYLARIDEALKEARPCTQ